MKPLFRLSALSVALANLFLSAGAFAQTSGYEIRKPVPGLSVQPASTTTTPTPTPPSPPPVLVPQLQLSTSSVDFGSVPVGQDSTAQVLVTNVGTGSLSITQTPSVTGSAFSASSSCSAPLAPNADCLVQVKFTPSQISSYSGSLSIASNDAQSPALVSLSGAGQGATGALTGLNAFGSVSVGSSLIRVFTFTNSGTTSATGVSTTLAGSGFALGANNCGTPANPVTVAAGGTCTVAVTFAPQTTGAVSGAQLSVASSALNSPSVLALSGTGVQAYGQLVASDSTDFGSLLVGADAIRNFVFSNTGTATATGVYAQVSGTGLSIASNTCGTSGTPVTVAAGGTCSIAVKYAPASAGTLTGQVSVVSSAPNSPSALPLSGSAQAATTQSLAYTGALRYMTVQATGDYTFRVFGAQGGSATSRTNVFGGKGAQANCTVTLTAGTMLKILVGQQGTSAANYGGGGGGTYVTLADNTPLCIAGGGSGSNHLGSNPGRGVVAGATGVGGVLTGSGTNRSAAGGGLLTDGASTAALGGGKAFVNGATGGTDIASAGAYAAGGLGGGGAGGMGNYNGGGGGGYNGGDGGAGTSGSIGLGGTSYISGTDATAVAGVQSGNGSITVLSAQTAVFTEVVASATLTASAGTDFGVVTTNTTTTRAFTFNNTGPLAISNAYVGVTGTGLSLTNNTCGTSATPTVLAAGSSCTVTVAYTPTAAGTLSSAVLSAYGSGITTKTASLTGSAMAPIAAGTVYYGPAVNSSTYGTVASGSSITRNVAIYNTSGQTLSGMGAPSLSGSAFYSITSTTCASTLATGSSCTVSVRYAPTAADTSSTLVSMDVPGVGTVSGKVFGSTSETLVYGKVSESGTLTLTAPGGKTLGEVVFASYGTPTGTTGATYVAGSCHAKQSYTLATSAFTGKATGSLAANNTTFGGDPCNGTAKTLAVAVRVY